MGLSSGYGVLIGTKQDYYRDPVDDYGRYYHGNLILNSNGADYHCAIDVDPKAMPDGIQWSIAKICAKDFIEIKKLSDDWHILTSSQTSGAIDYIRSKIFYPYFMLWDFCNDFWTSFLIKFFRRSLKWKKGTGIKALIDLEFVISQGTKFYVFGEPFTHGLGVHNIHQNQGDPVGSGFDFENGIWQDGITIVETSQGKFIGFMNKFKTQSDKTDDLGHPV